MVHNKQFGELCKKCLNLKEHNIHCKRGVLQGREKQCIHSDLGEKGYLEEDKEGMDIAKEEAIKETMKTFRVSGRLP